MLRRSDLRFTVTAPAGDFEVTAFTLDEALSTPFRLQLELVSFDPAIDFAQFLYQPLTLHIAQGSVLRHVHGLVSTLEQAGTAAPVTAPPSTPPWRDSHTERFDQIQNCLKFIETHTLNRVNKPSPEGLSAATQQRLRSALDWHDRRKIKTSPRCAKGQASHQIGTKFSIPTDILIG